MSQRKRFWFVLFSVIAVAAIAVLASGVSTLDMDLKGQPLPIAATEEERGRERPMAAMGIAIFALRALLTVAGALLPFGIVYYLVSPEARRRVLKDLLAVLGVVLPVYLLARARLQTLEGVAEPPVPQATSTEISVVTDVPSAPNPTRLLILAASVAVALLLAALLVGLGWVLWRRSKRPSETLDRLAREAQETIDAIEAGADLRDSVIRCYFEMMEVLKEKRGIRRQPAMTPREFERQLEEAGMPTTQVRRLTGLFEEVRYGGKCLDENDERQAIISLTSIVRFCRSAS